jgi:hypothetical protein
MPRLNHRGEVVAGPGRVWYDLSRIAQQREVSPNRWQVWTRFADDTWDAMLRDQGCNFIAAGAGEWLATTGGTPFGSHSVPDSYRMPAGLDGRGNAALDGTIALARSPENIGLVLKAASGREKIDTDAHLDSRIVVLDEERALWIDTRDGKPRTMGSLPVPLALPGAIPFVGGVVFDRQGTPWWLYHGEDRVGVVLQPFDSFLGYHLGPIPAYYLHAVNTEDGRARITYALNPEETVVNSTWVDWDAPRMDLRTLLGPIVLPPTDPPVDPPEPPTETRMKLPAHVQAAIRIFVLKFPLPSGLPPGDAAKEIVRPYMRKLAEYVKFATQENYGCKSTGPGANQSPDALAKPRNGSSLLWIWDIFGGTGTGNPSLNLDAESEPDHLSGQHFIPVKPFDHVGGVIVPPDDPDDPPQPGGITKAELESRLHDLMIEIDALVGNAIANHKDADHKPSDDVIRKGHPVEVKGTVSVPLLGSRTITSKGTL